MSIPDELIESIEGEAAVLGSMILDRACIPGIVNVLEAGAFHRPENRTVYNTIIHLSKLTDQKIDLVMIRDDLKRQKKLAEIGGVDYLVELLESTPSAANSGYYANMVKDHHTTRKLLEYATQVHGIACEHLTAEEKVAEATRRLKTIAAGQTHTETVDVGTTICDELDAIEGVGDEKEAPNILTGFEGLDNEIYGLVGGDMIVIAGRSSMGKTSLAVSIAGNIAERKVGVLFYSLEMTEAQLKTRMLIAETKNTQITLTGARKGYLTHQDHIEVAEAGVRISNWTMHIDPTPGLTLAALEARTHRHLIDHETGVIFIDYLQLMRFTAKKRYEGITDLSHGIKNLARKTNLPIVLISQLNRMPDKRDDKKPRLSDLRDSGAIEEAADIVILLYRGDYYTKGNTGQAEVIIAKQRNGDTGIVPLTFVKQWAAFVSPAPEEKGLYDEQGKG